MDPASRNRVLTVGGALIVVALLLVCGPPGDRFGKGGVETTPPVAAAPPVIPEPEVIAVEPAVVGANEDSGIAEPAPIAAVVAAPIVAAPAAEVASSAAAAPPVAPPVSAAPPPVVAPVVAGPSPVVLAQDAFDAQDTDALGGNLRDRFPPPVDSGPGSSLLALGGFGEAAALKIRPCDTPGAGCRKVIARTTVPAGIPPISSQPRQPRTR